jgi:hypothetical protein
MKFEDVKVDEIITHQSGTKYIVKMVGVDRRIAVKAEMGGSVYFLTEDQLKYYTGKDKFYRVGKRYRFDSSREDTWFVLDVYQVTNPLYSWSKLKAVARMTTTEGKEDIQTLTLGDYERMVQV